MDKHDKAGREAEHTAKISRLFGSIAGDYDFLNRVQSMRRDIAWRRFTARKMRFFRTHRYLDVATGTADLAIEAALRHPEITVVGVDPVQEFLSIAREKVENEGLGNRIALSSGNALALDFDDGSFDVAGIAFGIRNIKDRVHALSEMARVVVPGGQVLVLELCYHESALLKLIYKVYLRAVIPALATLFSRNRDAYVYLGRSIMDFPTPAEFSGMMREAGLADIEHHPLTLGVARLFIGVKPA